MFRSSFGVIRLLLISVISFSFFSANAKRPVQALDFNNRSQWSQSDTSYPSAETNLAVKTGTWECVGAGLPDPCRNTLNSVDMVSTSLGWAVGDKGTILKWSENSWEKVTSPTTASLKSVDMVSSLSGWAVGENGIILRWNGTSWVQANSPTSHTLYAVKMQSVSVGYAAGDRDTLLRWNGTSWTIAYYGDNPYASMRALAVLGVNDVWAGGSAGWISHWNGSGWDTSGGGFSTAQITSLDFISTSEGWAVGQGSSGAIYRYKDGIWTDFSPPQGPVGSGFYAVNMASSSDGWIAGVNQGTLGLLHWDGLSWTTVQGPTIFNSFSLLMTSGSDGWAVGEGGQVLHFTNGIWQVYSSPQFSILSSVSMLSTSEGWAVGSGAGGAAIAHWDGTVWNSVPTPDAPYLKSLSSIKMFSPDDGWAVGDGGTIIRYRASAWAVSYSSNSVGGFHALDGVSSSDIWVGNGFSYGLGQDILMHWDGEWNQTFLATSARIDAIEMVSTDEGWFIGSNVVIHKMGSDWSTYFDSTVGGTAIDFISATDGWMAGGNSFYRWNGTTWNPYPYPTEPNSGLHPLTVAINASDDGWASGTGGLISHWNGISWAKVFSPTSNTLRSISRANDRVLWAVGDYGVTLWLNTSNSPSEYILSVPSLKQGLFPYDGQDPAWENYEYDDGKLNVLWCGKYIRQCGCAMTAASMVLTYYGIKYGPNGSELNSNINPDTINSYFKRGSHKVDGKDLNDNPISYFSSYGYANGELQFDKFKDYSQKAQKENPTQPLIEEYIYKSYDADQLRGYINQGVPVILKVNYPGFGDHFVLVKGYSGSSFIINDPIHPDPVQGVPLTTLETYKYTPIMGEKEYAMRIFLKKGMILSSDSIGNDYSSLDILTIAPTLVTITDPLGRTTSTGTQISPEAQQIPDAVSIFESAVGDPTGLSSEPPMGEGMNHVHIESPVAGIYKIEVNNTFPDQLPVFVYASNRIAASSNVSFILDRKMTNGSVLISYNPIGDDASVSLSGFLFLPFVSK